MYEYFTSEGCVGKISEDLFGLMHDFGRRVCNQYVWIHELVRNS